MIKNILSVIVGYVIWTVIFIGGAAVVRIVRPGVYDENGLTSDVPALVLFLILSFVASFAAGFVAVKIANSAKMLIAGILSVCLLATGVPVQLSAWNDLPVWYNLAFLIMLVPITMAGAAMANRAQQPDAKVK